MQTNTHISNVLEGNRLHGMLFPLFSQKLPPKEKEEILEREYKFETSVKLEGGLRQMCNLSDLVEARGIAKGIIEGRLEGIAEGRLLLIRKKIEKGKSVMQIADELEETVEDILPVYNALKEKQKS